MGYYIFSFGIKQKEISQVFNSKDKTIIQKVEANEYFENYNEDNDWELSTQEALHHIVNGDKLNSEYGYVYGYALISICATLGRELPYDQEIKMGYETEYINDILKNDFEIDIDIEEVLFFNENELPFEIPLIEDFPILNVIKLEDLKRLKETLASIKITDKQIEELSETDDEKSYQYENIRGIIENIDFCIENQLDMFTACH